MTQKRQFKISKDKPSGKGDAFKVNDFIFYDDVKRWYGACKSIAKLPNKF